MGEDGGDCIIGAKPSFREWRGIKGVSRGEERGRLVITGGTAGIILGELITEDEEGVHRERLRFESREEECRCRVLRGKSRSDRTPDGGSPSSLTPGASCSFLRWSSSRMNPMKRFRRTHFPTFTSKEFNH